MKPKTTIILFFILLNIFSGNAQPFTANPDYGIKISHTRGTLWLLPLSDNAIRVKYVEGETIAPLEELVYTEDVKAPKWKTKADAQHVIVQMKNMKIDYNKQTDQLVFIDKKGNIVLQEQARGRQVTHTEVGGVKAMAVSQRFISPTDEYLFGTGQFQDGHLNLRGLSRRLTQVNTQIAIPFILSSKGYGLLWNNYGLTHFNPLQKSILLHPSNEQGEIYEVNATSTHGGISERRVSDTFSEKINIEEAGQYSVLLDVGQKMSRKQYLEIDGNIVIDQNNTWLPPTTSTLVNLTVGTHTVIVKGVRGDKPTLYYGKCKDETSFSSPLAQALDYTVFVGNADQVVASYRHLTGEAPLMPDWMLGYIHCRERYNTQDELLTDARRFCEKNIPVDVIVQDWQYWGKYGWNNMRFDEDRYPDAKQMVDDLHEMNIRLMLSVWSKVEAGSNLGKEFSNRGYFIPGTEWVDFFNTEAAQFYWTNFRDKLYRTYHIDSWWLDATEPENDDLQGRMIAGGKIPGDLYRNVYPMKVVSTVYNGIKMEEPGKTPVILTRSAFSGMQRYNAVTWSGDVNCDLETLRRQIVGGLGYMSSGLPWWTYDAGGFFRPGNQYNNQHYQEWMLRWIECSVFLPLMRVHGYQSRTEPWNYSSDTERIYTNCIRERYELLPYIKECAKRITNEGYTMMRPLVFDFADDPEALKQELEYMFGPKYLICPIVREGVKTWRVYLPNNKKGWVDHYTQQYFKGGQYIEIPVTLEHIPVFERQ